MTAPPPTPAHLAGQAAEHQRIVLAIREWIHSGEPTAPTGPALQRLAECLGTTTEVLLADALPEEWRPEKEGSGI